MCLDANALHVDSKKFKNLMPETCYIISNFPKMICLSCGGLTKKNKNHKRAEIEWRKTSTRFVKLEKGIIFSRYALCKDGNVA